MILKDVSLAPLTTLALGGSAEYFVRVNTESELLAALLWAKRHDASRHEPVFFLGSGSNVIVSDSGVKGLVVQIAMRGVVADKSVVEGSETLKLTAAAGEPWDGLVETSVSLGYAGFECLSGIPGTVGAAPIQNVGAYGQEVSDTLVEVRAMEIATHQVRTFSKSECEFGYRMSRFKKNPGDWVILSVTFELIKRAPILKYAELVRAFDSFTTPLTVAAVRQKVLSLRRSKSMVLDAADENHHSAGSFFLNPVVTEDSFERACALGRQQGVLGQEEELPSYDAGAGCRKIPAAWLIEKSGFRKGERYGAVGISSKHALALVHFGGGASSELVHFAQLIQKKVQACFGLTLELEPIRVGDFDATSPQK